MVGGVQSLDSLRGPIAQPHTISAKSSNRRLCYNDLNIENYGPSTTLDLIVTGFNK